MSTKQVQDLRKNFKSLSTLEKLDLIAQLTRAVEHDLKPARSWSEIRGALPCPAFGEDAQEWVSRTRREGDECRERAIRGELVHEN